MQKKYEVFLSKYKEGIERYAPKFKVKKNKKKKHGIMQSVQRQKRKRNKHGEKLGKDGVRQIEKITEQLEMSMLKSEEKKKGILKRIL